jgi:hypothetical protein
MRVDKKELDKKKLINLVTQGEAKNTKHILHMPEVREGLRRILGNEDGDALFQALDRVSKAADKMDWAIPPQERGRHMMQGGDVFGGAFDVEWE